MADDERKIAFARPLGAAFALTVMGYAAWAAFTGHSAPTGLRIGFLADSAGDMRDARHPFWAQAFWAGHWGRPFPFLLLAKLCARNLRAIVLVQSAISAAAWLFLARTVGTLLVDTRVRTAAFVAILLLGLSPTVLQWNATILTESLSLSVLVLTTALLLEVVTHGRHFSLFLASLFAFALVRDTNAYVVIAAAVLAAIVVTRSDRRRAALAVVAVCLVAGFVAIGVAGRAQRWYQPLVETIAQRVLPSSTARNYFIARGMPWGPPELQLENDVSFRTPEFTNAPDLAPFRSWLADRGQSTYLEFLGMHPGWTLSKPIGGRAAFLTPEVRRYSSTFHNEPRGIFRVFGALTFPGSAVVVEVWCVGGVAAGIVLARRRSDRALIAALGGVALLATVGFFVSWHGDAFEIDRHALSSAVALRIVLLIVAALALDRGVSHRREIDPSCSLGNGRSRDDRDRSDLPAR